MSKSDGCSGVEAGLRPRGLAAPFFPFFALVAAPAAGLGSFQPFWWAMRSPCLITRRSMTRERAREERQVPLPVARRVGERAHLVERERERRAVAPPRREAEVGENLPLVDARGGRGRHPPARHWTAPAPPARTRTSYTSRSGWFGIAWTVTLRSISAPSRSIASRP